MAPGGLGNRKSPIALVYCRAKGAVLLSRRGAVRKFFPMKVLITPMTVRGRTLGSAGLGRIGKAVATRGEAFGMRVLAYEPYPDQAFVARHGIQLVSIDTLLAESDYLSLHLPFTDASKHLINERTLARM